MADPSAPQLPRTTIARELVENLLLRWQRGEVTSWFVVEEAEFWLEEFGTLPTLGPTDPDWPAYVIADDLLSAAHIQHILREDVPALLAFLNTPLPEAQAAHDRLNAYLELVCTSERARQAHQEYYPKIVR